ncbi:hypothetical protein P5706_15570 [Pseudomonas sp. ChxA]|uniref:hypothetical protein n=1 Tax=Pseudomonas sp. ChxA TaxID=3035473 RepID=UPI00255329A4|nr:hypothetical protein [Pseudomonas sp. ChxA]MDL2185603.1 hypothetical protein [Pseudomonas sp. ChxA]
MHQTFPFELDSDLFETLLNTATTRELDQIAITTRSPAFRKLTTEFAKDFIDIRVATGETLTSEDFKNAAVAGLKKAIVYHV